MRIHLSLHPQHFEPSIAGPSGPSTTSPLVRLGGELVILELQGELSYEGDKAGGVVGVIGLDRPDRPTLHLGPHHLLHGKIAPLPRPYAVIRRAVGVSDISDTTPGAGAGTGAAGTALAALEGDPHEEDEEDEQDEQDEQGDRADMLAGNHQDGQNGRKRGGATLNVRRDEKRRPGRLGARRTEGEDDDEDEEVDEAPLFAPNPDIFPPPSTPGGRRWPDMPGSSSPILPPSSMKEYSSELGYSSPARLDDGDDDDDDDDDEADLALEKAKEKLALQVALEEERKKRAKLEQRRKERKERQSRERTRHYQVVGVVRKKVVFALRPEPIVTATILPD